MTQTPTHTNPLWITDTKDGVIYCLTQAVNRDWFWFKSLSGNKVLMLDYDNLSRGIDCGVFKFVDRG